LLKNVQLGLASVEHRYIGCFTPVYQHIFTQNIYAGNRCVTMRAVGWRPATSE